MRVAIVGSRDYPDLDEVREFVRTLPKGTVVVTGDARGVDKVVKNEARSRGLRVKIHKAEWWKYGKGAGHIRNRDVVDDCDKLQAFWDGTSPGTKSIIALAKKAGKLLGVRRRGLAVQTELFGDN